MMKLVIIVGTRPEIIQSSVLIHQLTKENWLAFQVWNTGQHYNYEMSEIFQEELNVCLDRNFGVGSGSSMEQLAKIMVETEKALIEKIEVNSRGDVRRSKIFYLRELTGKKARIKEKRS